MSNEELAMLIKDGQAEHIPQLWDQVERFIWQRARLRANILDGRGGVTAEDLYQSGFFAVLAAIDAYDPLSGYKFLTYLVRPLKTSFAITAGYRTQRQQRDPLHAADSLDAPLSNDEDGGYTLLDGVSDLKADAAFDAVGEREWAEQLHRDLEAALAHLPESQRAAIRAKYYLGCKNLCAEDRKEELAAIKALRNPRISRKLRQYRQGW